MLDPALVLPLTGHTSSHAFLRNLCLAAMHPFVSDMHLFGRGPATWPALRFESMARVVLYFR